MNVFFRVANNVVMKAEKKVYYFLMAVHLRRGGGH